MTTIGVLGGGQLGRMLALAGYPLGFRFLFYDPAPDVTAGRLAELMCAGYDDEAMLHQFAQRVDIATYEFENVPVEAARYLEQFVPVYPPPRALEAAQDRLVEKTLFQDLNIPTAPFFPIDDEASLQTATEQVGYPAVLKTRRFGYDGKGQAVLRAPSDIPAVLEQFGGVPLLLEGHIPFDRECSILAVRSRIGEIRTYPLIENQHHEGILRFSLAPARQLDQALQATADSYVHRVADHLDYVGLLCIELFEWEGELYANEMAPRVHNSGHLTIDAAQTSQFENHLRAIAGLPLGATHLAGVAAMINLIGQLPEVASVLASTAHLHLYDKEPRPGRKIGHLTLRAGSYEELDQKVTAIQPYIPWERLLT